MDSKNPSTVKGMGQFRGHAGEMYVSAELMRRGWLAAMTARGSRSFDILAWRADKQVFAGIRVKTGHGSFLWSAKKDGTLFLDMADTGDFTVIVDMPPAGTPVYYVVPTAVVEAHLRQNHEKWLRTPGENDRPRSEATLTRCLYFDEVTDRHAHGYSLIWGEYRDAWHLLDEGTSTMSAESSR